MQRVSRKSGNVIPEFLWPYIRDWKSWEFQDVIKREWQAGLVITVKYPDDPNWSFSAIHDYCYERGFTIYPGKINNTETFRLCALGAVDEADIQEFFKVFQAGLESMKVAVPVFYREEK